MLNNPNNPNIEQPPNNIDKIDIRGCIRDLIVKDTNIELGTHQRNDSFGLLAANEKIKIGGLSLSLVLDFDPPKQLSFRFYKSESTFDKLIGPWLQNKINEYTNFQGLDIRTSERKSRSEGNIAYFVLKIDWQNWENIEYAEKESVKNLAERLIEFCEDELSGENLEIEIEQFNNDNPKALLGYDLYKNTNDQHNDVARPEATNQGSTKKTTIDNLPRNLIYFGAPGTGKSYKLNKALENFGENNFERVTFYPTYSYAQFVGTYKPVMVQDNTGNNNGNTGREEIAYQFVPGPFLRVLTKAINNPDINFCLVIEEINRSNAAAVFGDVFQLLDRNSNGESEYSIAASEDIKKYLIKEIKKNIPAEKAQKLSIPQNMYIWATMNSADQGVFPIDTAFKRRWSFEYIGIDGDVTVERNGWVIEGPNINWNDFRRFVNGLLSSFDVNEDKLMGPYFVKADKKVDNIDQISENSFASKVLMYLWEDAARMIRKNIFGAEIKTYSQLVSEWKDKNIRIFDNCKSKWENNTKLSTLYDNMNHSGDTQSTTQEEDASPADNA